MGKYMRKAKMTTDVAVMEVSQSSLGVRTRAKTLALQRLQSTTAITPPPPPANPESSYLQLRSRRLEKPPLINRNQRLQSAPEGWRENPNSDCCSNPRVSSRLGLSSVNSGSVGSVSVACNKKGETEENSDWGIEASFGENNLDFEGRERSTRESTPCSLMRDTDIIDPPGSTTRQRSASTSDRRNWDSLQRSIPTTQEIDDFFALAEQPQQRLFSEKYNFDISIDLPLPGRYEWVKVDI